jgi:hypothetical protein
MLESESALGERRIQEFFDDKFLSPTSGPYGQQRKLRNLHKMSFVVTDPRN